MRLEQTTSENLELTVHSIVAVRPNKFGTADIAAAIDRTTAYTSDTVTTAIQEMLADGKLLEQNGKLSVPTNVRRNDY